MKANVGIAVAVLLIAAAIIAVRWWQMPVTPPAASNSPVSTVTLQTSTSKVGAAGTSLPAGIEPAAMDERPLADELAPLTEPAWQVDPAATASLRDAMINGDARTPPLAPSAEREQATAEELADPDLYAAYEQRQQMQVYQSFLQAAEKQIDVLQADIARARAEGGVSEAQLQEGQRKLEALQRQRDEVAARYPELVAPASSDSEAAESP